MKSAVSGLRPSGGKSISRCMTCSICLIRRATFALFRFQAAQHFLYKSWISHALLPGMAVEQTLPEWFHPEDKKARQQVYLVTFAALVNEKACQEGLKDVHDMSREGILDAVLDAVGNPCWDARGGRPRKHINKVLKMVVAKEQHQDGTWHFHVAIRLKEKAQWAGFKNALLQRHRLASHWSEYHSEWWSAVRYVYYTTPKKPVVDKGYVIFIAGGEIFDDATQRDRWMVAQSEEGWNAAALRHRREQADRMKHEVGNSAAPSQKTSDKEVRGADQRARAEKKQKEVPFAKLDFFALMETEVSLKTPAQVRAYAKQRGGAKMQAWVASSHKNLPQFIREAEEWIRAEELARDERLSDWALIQSLARQSCRCEGGLCQWWEAADDFFKRNKATMNRHEFATSLAKIIQNGPGKNSRVPLIVGGTNCGKSTVLNAIIAVFGFENIVHRPGETASMALANISKGNKRFIYWDEARPVELAARGTVPVGSFLSLFSGGALELTISQSFNNGNAEIRWQRGAAMTAKEEGLWDPVPSLPGVVPVSKEDIRHMQSRVHQFVVTAPVPRETLGGDFAEVPECRESFCRWLVLESTAYAYQAVERPLRHLSGRALPPMPQGCEKRVLTEAEKKLVEENRAKALKLKGTRRASEISAGDEEADAQKPAFAQNGKPDARRGDGAFARVACCGADAGSGSVRLPFSVPAADVEPRVEVSNVVIAARGFARDSDDAEDSSRRPEVAAEVVDDEEDPWFNAGYGFDDACS